MIIDQVGVNRLAAPYRHPQALAPDGLPCHGVVGLDIVGHDAVNNQVSSFPVARFNAWRNQRGGFGAAAVAIKRNGKQPADAVLSDRLLGEDDFMKVGIGAEGLEAPLGDCDRHIGTPL